MPRLPPEKLCGPFAGLDRLTASNLLDPTHSPDTTDAAHYLDVDGVIGPRRGRKSVYYNTTRIRGVVGCNLPGMPQRIIGDVNGTWAPIAATVVAPGTYVQQTPWVTVINYTLTKNLIGQAVGDAYSHGVSLGQIDLSKYTQWGFIINGAAAHMLIINTPAGTGSYPAVAHFQGLIDNVWQNLITVTGNAQSGSAQIMAKPATGILSAVRSHLSTTIVGNNLAVGVSMVLVKGTVNSTTVVNL